MKLPASIGSVPRWVWVVIGLATLALVFKLRIPFVSSAIDSLVTSKPENVPTSPSNPRPPATPYMVNPSTGQMAFKPKPTFVTFTDDEVDVIKGRA